MTEMERYLSDLAHYAEIMLKQRPLAEQELVLLRAKGQRPEAKYYATY